ncbi:tRNA N(3)-cytidine methyltransferase METTL2-like [Diadema antillarum]|uniref:tRNA N(3)-cytidine methyltransferase METTL2-like n=1 Tax=Diadema antillarum TaxID=105358 RepID=UPI003A85F3C6
MLAPWFNKWGRVMAAEEETSQTAESQVKRPPFGNRFLENPENVFQHNAWDNVTWDAEQLEAAKKKVEENSEKVVDSEKREEYETEADRYWNEFYSQHQNKFFKDRHWLFTEFPELSSGEHHEGTAQAAACGTETKSEALSPRGVSRTDCQIGSHPGPPKENVADEDGMPTSDDADIQGRQASSVTSELSSFPGESATRRILEVGCGVGNTIFPILQTNADPGLMVYGCDFSSVAVDIIKQHAEYDPKRCHAFVCDVSDMGATFPFPKESLDVIVMIFVLSAINPDKFQSTINTLSGLLRPGGMLLFRDYGRYDLAQLRFKKGRCLAENFYVRGDGTRVYFFTQEELRTLFTKAGLVEEQNLIDKRLQVNRGRQLTMYRVWIQCKYRKS